ncbi:hypothetical protein FCV25MIE_34502 [Fagus crenata]
MAKSASTCEMRRSEMKPMDFSEPEMDVAEQLIQLSGDSGACTDDVSSTNGEIFPYNDSVEEDETFCPRKRRRVDWLRRSAGLLRRSASWFCRRVDWLRRSAGLLHRSASWIRRRTEWLRRRTEWLRRSAGWLRRRLGWFRRRIEWLRKSVG